jgi:hypothetical protein
MYMCQIVMLMTALQWRPIIELAEYAR